jgi:predicted  nucleic acid-binding Zn-ribbon protein
MEDVTMGDAASLPPHANSAHDDSVNRVQRDIKEVKESIKKTEGNIESTEADLKCASQNVFSCAPDDKDYWKLTAAKLMDKEAALRTEKAKLMDEKAKLMDKEAKLRDDVRNAY